MTGTRQLTALRATWLFDGEVLRPDPVVLVDGGTVVGVGSAPPGVEVVDLPGATLLPGLVDPHVHLDFDASGALAAMATAARTALLAGITTVRDLGDQDYLALALRDRPDLPTILAAGPPITTPATEAILAAVRERAERGCDLVKIVASGFGVAELRAAVDQAHRLGLPVAVHAHGETAMADAVAAGTDSLEHVSFRTKDGVIKAIVAERVIVGATMGGEPSMPNLRRLVAEGAIVVVGTGPGHPHATLPHVLPDLLSIGMSPVDALRTVTSKAAGACGLATTKGRLLPGRDADILVVDGNPLTDPTALARVRAVYKNGVLVS
jgi:imidazolonepropionase-like amidohydrolase